MILWVGRAAEMIPRKLEAVAYLFLQKVLPGAKGADILARHRGSEFGGGAVLIGRANEQCFAAAGALETAENVRRQLRAR